MSKLPLLNAGNIVIQKWMTAAEKSIAESAIPIEYVVDFVRPRLPEMKSGTPKIVAKSGGERILLLKSYTGSGKSMVPVYMHKAFFDILHKNTVITEPRVLTTIEITEGTVPFSGLKMEETIGYQTGQFHKRPIRGVIFMTTGVLNMQLKSLTDEEIMRRYMIIIIDECHDRDVNNDMLMFLLKEFLSRNYENPACPMVILMSATFEVDLFSEYFGVPKSHYIECKGLTYEVKQNFPEVSPTNLVVEVANLVKQIHLENVDDLKLVDLSDKVERNKSIRDIIVFCDTTGTIKKMAEAVIALNDEPEIAELGLLMPIYLDRVNYGLGGLEYRNFKLPPSELRLNGLPIARRVIFTTPFAETGITIDGLKYCIDTGVSLQVIFNPIFGATRIASRAVSQDMAVQRRGRVGRKAPGVWYPLYTKKLFDKMQASKYPDILRTDISSLLLGVIVSEHNKLLMMTKKEIFDVTDLDIMGYPSADTFEYSINKLSYLGFVRQTPEIAGAKHGATVPTRLGELAIKIAKISLENIRMIMAGYYWGANVRDLITIAAFTEVGWKDIMEQRLDGKYKPRNPLNLYSGKASKIKTEKKAVKKSKTGKSKETEQEKETETEDKSYTITGACGMDQNLFRNILNRNGWKELSITEAAKIGKVGFMYVELNADKRAYEVKSDLSSLLNDNRFIICDKSLLYKNMLANFPNIANEHMARSYLLADYEKLEQKDKFDTCIIKPVGRGSYSGKGITVATSETSFKNGVALAKTFSKEIMVSEYISDVMLFNKRKFHIRSYLVVYATADGDKVVGQLWKRGKILTAKLPYKNMDFGNRNIHDTHAISTPNDFFFPEHLGEQGINTAAIFEQMNKIANHVVDLLNISEEKFVYPESKSAAAIFGLDFLVTSDYVVKLLECNDKIGCASVMKFPDFSPTIGPWTKEYSEFTQTFYDWYYNFIVKHANFDINRKEKYDKKQEKIVEGKYSKPDLYFKLMWCDEWLEFLWLWYEILEVDPEELEEWCAANKVKYMGLLSALVLRDEIIESFVAIGMNPMYFNLNDTNSGNIGSDKGASIEHVKLIHKVHLPKLLQVNLHEGMEEIVKIKHCIFDGYKCNLAIWNGSSYTLAWKRLEIDNLDSPLLDVRLSDLEQKNPRYIICQNYAIIDTGMPKQTMLTGQLVSIMDGFINVDEHTFDFY